MSSNKSKPAHPQPPPSPPSSSHTSPRPPHHHASKRNPVLTEHSYLLAEDASPAESSASVAPTDAVMAPSQLFELPRPRKFLRNMSLRTGAEIITYLQVINKVSGLYGLLALLTGAAIDGWQLSMYLYSTVLLLATVYLFKHIRLQSPFESLLLAHLYALDSVVNALYTAFFGVIWFYTIANHPTSPGNSTAPGLAENAGFTSPKFNVSEVNVVAEPADGLKAGQNAVAVGHGTPQGPPGLRSAILRTDSIMSIAMISGFWALRVYFVFVMLSFARQCLRQHIAANASSSAWYDSNNATQPAPSDLAENPFEDGKEEGYGVKGKVGRIMLRGAPQYWLGADEDNTWMRGVGGKFNRKSTHLVTPIGLGERERRRRSGTGPPAPPRELRPQSAPLTDVR